MNLTQIIKKIAHETDGENTTLNDIVEKLQSRGFGPLLIAPSIVAVLPTGAIPTVPSICALSITFIVSQMIVGKNHPWLPQKLKKIEISRDKLQSGAKRIVPYTRKVDSVFKPRLTFLTNAIGKRVVSLIAAFTALLMIPLEIVPFAAALPATAVIFMGLGISTEDGLMSSLGVLLSVLSSYFAYTQFF